MSEHDPLPAEQAIASLDPEFFFDYATVSGALRHYAAEALLEHHLANPNPLNRRFYALSLYREEYSAYEDLGALVRALLLFRSGKTAWALAPLLDYREQEANVGRVFEENAIATGVELYQALKLDEWLPEGWADRFPTVALPLFLRTVCEFFVKDCATNQRRYGLRAYNKIKHGLAVVPSASRYRRKLPDAPGMIFRTDRADPRYAQEPLTLLTFHTGESDLEERRRAIDFIQQGLRLLAGLYVVVHHPDVVVARGLRHPLDLFEGTWMADVMSFGQQVTARG